MYTVLGTNGFGGKHYAIQGAVVFGLEGLTSDILEHGDSITDRNGKGTTVYVHQCPECGKKFCRSLMALLPPTCGCDDQYWR